MNSKVVINDLLDYGYKIVQNNDYFKFSIDSVLLADFVKIDYTDRLVLDFCTGTAPIPIILSRNNKIKIYGMEVQKEIYDMAMRSIKINKISNVEIIYDDIKSCKNYFPGNNFDIITCNPPYFKMATNSIINNNNIKSIARHEIKVTLDDIIKEALFLLKSGGKLSIVHRTERIMEIIQLLNKYHFGIKRMQFAYPNSNKKCNLVLIEAKKNNKDNCVVMAPIFTDNYRRIV